MAVAILEAGAPVYLRKETLFLLSYQPSRMPLPSLPVRASRHIHHIHSPVPKNRIHVLPLLYNQLTLVVKYQRRPLTYSPCRLTQAMNLQLCAAAAADTPSLLPTMCPCLPSWRPLSTCSVTMQTPMQTNQRAKKETQLQANAMLSKERRKKTALTPHQDQVHSRGTSL
ncbi:hypothetical protein VTK56DRAFT_3606 [Thermocarpiscus australiensis]